MIDFIKTYLKPVVDYERLYRRERKTTQLLRKEISDLEEKLKASECTCKKESTCCTT